MSGQKIHDHKSWVGSRSEGSVFPMGVKHKSESSAEGAGKVGKYEDTSEAIRSVQSMNDSKAKGHKQKDGYFH